MPVNNETGGSYPQEPDASDIPSGESESQPIGGQETPDRPKTIGERLGELKATMEAEHQAEEQEKKDSEDVAGPADTEINSNPSPEAAPASEKSENEAVESDYSNIVFDEKMPGRFVSSDPGRKQIELSPDSPKPILGRQYEIKVIHDTKPGQPDKGKLVAVIVGSSHEVSDQEWQHLDKQFGTHEAAYRAANIASRQLYKQTNIPASERRNMPVEQVVGAAKSERLAWHALRAEEESRQLNEALSKDPNANALLEFRQENLVKALRKEAEINSATERLYAAEVDILQAVEGTPRGAELVAIQEIRSDIEELQRQKHDLMMSSPEAYYGLHLEELKEYHKNSGRIIETGYVKEKAHDILVHLRAGKPVLIYGHLGSGKTEVAMHIAREYMEKEALVISGAKNMSAAEIYGHQVLSLDQVDRSELDQFNYEVGDKFDTWVQEHNDRLKDLNPEAQEAEKNRAHDRLLQIYLTQFRSGTISEFFLGPIYQAMEQGRPIIVDEVNAIPHEVLISLNHLMTRRAGDEVLVQQDSGRKIKIEEGYGVMMTGNLNQGDSRYVGRQDLDPAWLSRSYKVEYDYLPQTTEGTLAEEASRNNEFFQLMLAKTMDKNGNLELPEDGVKKLWNLAKAGRIIQNVFSGKEVDKTFFFKEGGSRATRYLLKESVLSNRAVTDILNQWQSEGYRNEFDYYLWKEFVSQSTEASDRAYLYQILKDQFNFFQGEGWEQSPDYGSGGKINSFDIKAPVNASLPTQMYGPREVVDFAFGPGPKRKEWPDPQNGGPRQPA